MFTIDFTKPWLYKDAIYFNQGNLATNNILRCKLVTGGDTSLEGYIASVTFKTLSNAEINDFAAIVDAKNCVIDIKFPSNALEVGVNVLEIILTKGEGIDKVVTPSPSIKYEVWQCITTGNGIQGDNNYPILIDLISSVNNVVRVANDASVTAKVALSQASNMRDSIEDALVRANETIKNTNNAKNEALEAVEDVNRAIAAGTQDLEVKSAREDMDGVVHDTLNERLENDLKIGSKSLKQEVLDLAGLKESQEMAYETDKGYLVCKETKVGTVKDLKISGKSLVNLCTKRKLMATANGSSLVGDIGKLACPIENGIEFTVIAKIPSDLPSSHCFVRAYDVNGSNKVGVFDGKELYQNRGNVIAKKVVNQLDFETPAINIRLFANISANSGDIFSLDDVMVIIGDHTQTPPPYFEGIASVGTGADKIEVSSVKSDGNLFDKSSLTEYIIGNDVEGVALDYHRMYASGYKFYINTDDVITFSYKCKETTGDKNPRFRFVYTDGSQASIHILTNQNMTEYTLTSNRQKKVSHIEVIYSKALGNWIVDLDSIMINKGTSPIPYQPCKQDKKPVLFKDTDGNWKPITELRGVDAVCDTVELHSDGKYYYHIRTENIIVNGSEDIVIHNVNKGSGFRVNSILNCKIYDANKVGYMICDKYNQISYGDYFNIEGVVGISCHNTTGTNLYIKDPKFTDVESLKRELQSNPITLIYELAEEKVFEVNPLFLESYEDETMISLNSGVINAPIEFKIASYITNLVLLNQQRISLIEQEMFNMFKQVLSGDMYSLAEKLYPEDFIEEDRPMLLI